MGLGGLGARLQRVSQPRSRRRRWAAFRNTTLRAAFCGSELLFSTRVPLADRALRVHTTASPSSCHTHSSKRRTVPSDSRPTAASSAPDLSAAEAAPMIVPPADHPFWCAVYCGSGSVRVRSTLWLSQAVSPCGRLRKQTKLNP